MTADDRVCPRCGALASEAMFCAGCGLNLSKQGELPTAEAFAARQREEAWLARQEARPAEAPVPAGDEPQEQPQPGVPDGENGAPGSKRPAAPAGSPPPASQDTSGFAIAAFVLGLLGVVVLAPVFAILALRRIRQRGQGGRGLAIAGLALSAAWTLAIGLVIGIGFATGLLTGAGVKQAFDGMTSPESRIREALIDAVPFCGPSDVIDESAPGDPTGEVPVTRFIAFTCNGFYVEGTVVREGAAGAELRNEVVGSLTEGVAGTSDPPYIFEDGNFIGNIEAGTDNEVRREIFEQLKARGFEPVAGTTERTPQSAEPPSGQPSTQAGDSESGDPSTGTPAPASGQELDCGTETVDGQEVGYTALDYYGVSEDQCNDAASDIQALAAGTAPANYDCSSIDLFSAECYIGDSGFKTYRP